MTTTHPMISKTPTKPPVDTRALADCIDACFASAQACATCADACLSEKQVDALRRTIRLTLDCADVCRTTGNVLSRVSPVSPEIARGLLDVCARACRATGEESLRHASSMEHVKMCAEAVRACEQACSRLMGVMQPAGRA